jgi:hypothetical protein
MTATSLWHASGATLTTVATFPEGYFLENLAVRADGSMLVTASVQKELWYLPRPTRGVPLEAVLVHTFDGVAMGIAETEPDIFFVSVSAASAPHECYLVRLDLNSWRPGLPLSAEIVVRFDDRARTLNGSCLVAPDVLLLADSFAGLIWRAELPRQGRGPKPRVWLEHASMSSDPTSETKPPQPGVNGIRFAPRSNMLYYTSTSRRVFMRVPVDPVTHEPAGDPELISRGTMGDDFCIDEDAGVAYVATHRQNTVDRVPLSAQAPDRVRRIVAGDRFDADLVGPSSGAWGRDDGDLGRRAYFTSDGGAVAPPPDGKVRSAKVLQLEFLADPTQ